MGLSHLGILHTVIGVVAILAAFTGFIRNGKIELDNTAGKTYFYCTLVASLTALGISKRGVFNAGHVFSLIIIILVTASYYLHNTRKGHVKARYYENFLLSFSLFLSFLPTVNETFTRVPVGHPLAKDITDPVIGKTLLVILMLFIAGSVAQFRIQRRLNRLAAGGRQ